MMLTMAIFLCMTVVSLLAAEDNLLRGIRADFETPPVYRLTRNAGDPTDLTDGKIINDNIWFYKEAVGWDGGQYYAFSFDLGKIVNAGKVRLHLSAGRSGVNYPEKIYVLGSADGKSFEILDEIMQHTTTPPYDGVGTRLWAESNPLDRQIRYIKFLVLPEVEFPYFFCDEAELAPLAGKGKKIDENNSFAGETWNILQKMRLNQRMEMDLSVLERNRKQLKGQGNSSDLTKTLRANFDTMTAIREQDSDFPLNKAQEMIAAEKGKLLRAAGFRGVLFSWGNHRDPMNSLTLPDFKAQAEPIRLYPGERRSFVFHLTNAQETAQNARFAVSAPFDFTVDKAVASTDSTLFFNANRLERFPDAGGHFDVRLLPGETVQIFGLLRVPENARPGDYPIEITAPDGQKHTCPVAVGKTWKMPAKFSAKLGFWDYLSALNGKHGAQVTRNNLPRALELMRENRVDWFWCDEKAIPVVQPQMFSAEKLTTPLDFRAFDAWMEIVAEKGDVFGLFLPRHFAKLMNFGCDELKDPKLFQARFGEYLNKFANHLRTRWKKDPSKFYVHCFDEASTPEQKAIMSAWAAAVRMSGSGFRTYGNPSLASGETFQEADLLMPLVLYFRKEYLDCSEKRASAKLQFGLYSCSNRTRQRDPERYYALPFRLGFLLENFFGTGFWNLATAANNISELQYRGRTFSVWYFQGDRIFSSKQFEAIYAAREDYEYLLRLKNLRPADAQAQKQQKVLLDRAKTLLLKEAAEKNVSWNAMYDRNGFEKLRNDLWMYFESLQK